MNRWLMIRRLRAPAILVLFGVTALLHEWRILSFGQSWPLYLILLGVLALAERAAFVAPDPSQGQAYPPPPNPYAPQAPWQPVPSNQPGTSLVTAPANEIERQQGGQ